MKPVTLRELARELGVSAMAVSMALRNHPHVSAELRRRAQALARARGYVPNPAWSRRSSQRRRGEPPMPLAFIAQLNPVWPYPPDPILRAVEKSGERLGYRIQPYIQTAQLPAERLKEVLWQTGVEALMLGPLFDEHLLTVLPWRQFSVVAIGAGHVPPPCHWVTSDLGLALWNTVLRCLERGYRRLLLLQYAEPKGPADRFERDSGIRFCREEVAQAGGRLDVVSVAPRHETEVVAPTRRLRPDAVIGQTGFFYHVLRGAGLKLGDSIGYAVWSLDRQAESEGLSGCSDEVGALADHTVRLLDAEVRAFERGLPTWPVKQLIPMTWREGRTLPPRARRVGCGKSCRTRTGGSS